MAVKVIDLVREFDLKIYNEGLDEAEVSQIEINRCGLQLSGYYDCFEETRVQIIGNAENSYLHSLAAPEREKAVGRLLSHPIPCVVITNNNGVTEDILSYAKQYGRWVLGTHKTTSSFHVDLTIYLQSALAESTSCHGDLLDVYGVGVLITGQSGIGKSETALELIRNGHLLIADDYVIIKKIGADNLVGTCSEITKNLMEIRGIGIIDINSLFGLSAIRIQKNIEIVINLEPWDDNEFYERVGQEYEMTAFLDIKLPYIRVPVKPGRNLAAIVEIAALNYRQNLMNGGNSVVEKLNQTIKRLSQ